MSGVSTKTTPAPILKQVADLWCLYASSRSPCPSFSNADYRERVGKREKEEEGLRIGMIVQNVMHNYVYVPF